MIINGNGSRTYDMSDISVATKKKIGKYFQKDIIKIIEQNQNENTLFVLCVNWYELFDEKEVDGESGNHAVLCKGIKNGQFEIYDPGPYKKPVYINADKVIYAMSNGSPYTFLMVKNED